MNHSKTLALAIAAASLFAAPLHAGQPGAAAPAAGAVELAQNPADDPAARQLVLDSIEALKKLGPVSFQARYASAGGPMVIDGKADIRFVRNNAVPADSLFYGVGRLQMPALKDPDFNVSRYADGAGRRNAWINDAAKVVYDRPEGPGPDGKETDGGRQTGLVLRSMLMPPLVNAAPFAEELKESRAGTDVVKFPFVFLPNEQVGGEECRVIRVIMKAGQAERKIWISPADKLPRKYEQFRNGLSRYWEITSVKSITDMGTDAAKLKAPDGYRVDRYDEGGLKAPESSQPARPATAQPVQVPPGGPAVGQIAPEFDLKSADGSSVSLASLKGQTVVLHFGGTLFAKSWVTQSAASAPLAGKPVKVLSLACREGEDTARTTKAFADAKGAGTLLLAGDATAGLYNIRGFPSTVVINGQGRVAAFFEGVVTARQLEDAVAAAAAN